MKFVPIIFFLFFCCAFCSAQSLINLKKLSVQSDTIFLDTLSVVENSIYFVDENGNQIENLKYKFNFEKSTLIFDEKPSQNIFVMFKTFPINFFKSVQNFDREKFMLSDKNKNNSDYDFFFSQSDYDSFHSQTELSRKGSISRGLSFGNSQNVIVNSNLDLQLDGKISDDLFISAVISDNNIPIQPDGNSQQLQEFDKVFIKIYNSHFSVTAGDFEQKKPNGYFLNYYKKSQGAYFTVKKNFDSKQKNQGEINASLGAAVAKGKYFKQSISGVEGNQGPYRLTGANGETYVVVLAGTEKVYIDGILMNRGSDKDYIIDYNLGEITFTAHQPMNKDKRVIVEFEYTDQNYTRFLVTSSNTVKFAKTDVWLNLYNESDSKNHPINQNLDADEKKLMGEIGDNILNAVIPGYDSLAFNVEEVRYKLVDTLVDGVFYDSVFVYSTYEKDAFYRVAFSLVGENKGNYILGVSSANGRVYEWVSPINGVPQGNYIPYTTIVAPQKKQMANLGAKTKFSDKTLASIEIALSKNDINTFSKLDADDNKGIALKSSLEQFFVKNKKNVMSIDVNYEFVSKNFEAVEYFRETEFVRNWNLNSYYAENNAENLINANLKYFNKKHGNSALSSSFINRGIEYSGIKNDLLSKYSFGTWTLDGSVSLLNSKTKLYTTDFLRHNFSVSKQLGMFYLGLKEQAENNVWKNFDNSYLPNSMAFNQFEGFAQTVDSLKNKFALSYKYRTDKLPYGNILKNSTTSQDISLSSEIGGKNNHRLKTTLNYRLLTVRDTSLYTSDPENNLTGKLEYNFRLFKGVVNSSTLYEIGSGLENKIEYSYIEVAAGQGVYSWTDYNQNGIQELDEFELAFFVDQANFIRVQMPSTQYIKVYSNQFNQSLNINPALRWKTKTGIRKFLSHFSDQFAYSISQKNTSSKFAEFANPFAQKINIDELVSLTSSIRNNFSINKGNPKFGIDYIIQSNNSKSLLTSGFDSRSNFSHNILFRYSFGSKLSLQNTATSGNKMYESQFFSSKSFKIDNLKNNFQLNFQPNLNNRISVTYNLEYKKNILGKEILSINDAGIEYRLNSANKGSLNANFNFIYYDYIYGNNSAVDYEMLQGLQPGVNYTWGLNFQRQLSNGLQINLSYTGRKSEASSIVHTANVQLRAFF